MKKKSFLYVSLVLMLCGCSATMKNFQEVLVESSQPQKPAWYDQTLLQEGEFIYAVGHSLSRNSEQEAKDDALARAVQEIVKYSGVTVEAFDRSVEASSIQDGKEYYTSDFETKRKIRAKAFVKRALPMDWYIQKMAKMQGNKKVGDSYLASVYLRAPENEIERIQEEKDVKLSLDIGLYYEDETGKLQYLNEGHVLNSGEGYALYVRPTDNCYLYVFQVDDLGRSYRLFPNAEYFTGENPIKAGEDYWIPNSEQYFFLDETTGKERFYLFASLEKIIDLEGAAALEQADFNRVLTTMGVGGLKTKLNTYKVEPPKKQVQAAEVKKKLQAKGAFVYETWFWHR
ncbi:DUF4384 domain-containing protein [candidate division KSB1 bacterium]|nr:DUF4384 domain-containing protein [candidate division KSB1 bacterium]